MNSSIVKKGEELDGPDGHSCAYSLIHPTHPVSSSTPRPPARASSLPAPPLPPVSPATQPQPPPPRHFAGAIARWFAARRRWRGWQWWAPGWAGWLPRTRRRGAAAACAWRCTRGRTASAGTPGRWPSTATPAPSTSTSDSWSSTGYVLYVYYTCSSKNIYIHAAFPSICLPMFIIISFLITYWFLASIYMPILFEQSSTAISFPNVHTFFLVRPFWNKRMNSHIFTV